MLLFRIKKYILLFFGFISLILGIIGIVVPLLPTTPFLLLSAFCFAESSEKLHNWLETNKIFGKYLSDYRSGKGIPIKQKMFILTLLWLAIGYSLLSIELNKIIKIFLFLIALGVTYHIYKIKNKKN